MTRFGAQQKNAADILVAVDAMEALIGALYLDGGLDPARQFVRRAWEVAMSDLAEPPKDPKTGLQYDGVTKRKFGVEATYSLLSWLAASARFDRVDPDVDDTRFSFSVISPRIIFHTGWQSTDQLVLQYSHWFNGGLTTVRVGDPPAEDITVIPDGDMLSLSARMWW